MCARLLVSSMAGRGVCAERALSTPSPCLGVPSARIDVLICAHAALRCGARPARALCLCGGGCSCTHKRRAFGHVHLHTNTTRSLSAPRPPQARSLGCWPRGWGDLGSSQASSALWQVSAGHLPRRFACTYATTATSVPQLQVVSETTCLRGPEALTHPPRHRPASALCQPQLPPALALSRTRWCP